MSDINDNRKNFHNFFKKLRKMQVKERKKTDSDEHTNSSTIREIYNKSKTTKPTSYNLKRIMNDAVTSSLRFEVRDVVSISNDNATHTKSLHDMKNLEVVSNVCPMNFGPPKGAKGNSFVEGQYKQNQRMEEDDSTVKITMKKAQKDTFQP